MKKYSYIFTDNKASCTGCGACAQTCAHGALTMMEDEEGFLFPSLNPEKCVDCGLCDKCCPMVNETQANINYQQKYYIAASKKRDYTSECATIGLCTMVAEEMIRRGGHVYAVVLEPDSWKVHHIHVTDIGTLMKTRNSKYAQSDTNNSYAEINQLLKAGEKVLFVGTPCQVAGLKAFVKKGKERLYTIDLICHGVYSYKLLQKEIAFWEYKYGGKVANFKFRSKRKYGYACGGMINFDIIKNDKMIHIERAACSSPIYAAYAYNKFKQPFNLRLSCYNCHFREDMRYGDMTIGDSRGVNRFYSGIDNFRNYYSGTTIFSFNSLKAEEMYNWVSCRINTVPINRNHFFCQNALKQTNRKVPKDRELIYKASSSEYEMVLRKTLDVSFDREMKKWRNRMIKSFAKKFLTYLLLWRW